MSLTKLERRIRIKHRIRKRLSGVAEKPRMSVYRSNKEIYVQLIDDIQGKTLIAASSKEKGIAEKKDITKIEQAKLVGKLIAEKATASGISQVVFDRNGYLYHGRVKSLADAARENGLKF
ncbi:MAG: 50S ribosomal protein L18 [Bacteroidales bacterium]|nr:50S ribosomal protein L18 [Bacteroidales bacterium]MCB8999237.1 50S ribosomal protein L18 [Bacteroidales bacterium]MCB9013095.1 50S ribosomal protein L18 [Bacteroidales bacterium]